MKTVRTSDPGDHIAVADLLRATAISGVVLIHFVPLGTIVQPFWDAALALGCWSVDAFFILSGFLLGQPYFTALLGGNALPSWRLYAARRFLRIWPAYAVAVLFSAMLLVLHHGRATASNVVDVAMHLTMLHGFSSQFLFGAGNGALWTMAVDAQFYVLLPLGAVALAVIATKVEQRSRPLAFATAIGSVIALSLAARLTASILHGADRNDDSIVLYAVQRNALGMACAFGAGLLLAQEFVRTRGIHTNRWPLLLMVGLAVETFAMNVAWLWPALNSAIRLFAYDVCGTISAACLLVVMLTLQRRFGPFARFVRTRFVVEAAAFAYAVYLVHWPLRQAVFVFLLRHSHVAFRSPEFVVLLVAASLPLIAVAAYVLHRFVEQPFLQTKARFQDRTAGNSAPPVRRYG